MRRLAMLAATVIVAALSMQANAAIVYQQTVSSVDGEALLDTAPSLETYGRLWIVVDTGTITGGSWEIESLLFISWWDPFGGGFDNDGNPIPALSGNEYFTYLSCASYPSHLACDGPVSTALAHNVFAASFVPPPYVNNCGPVFTGNTNDCAFDYQFGHLDQGAQVRVASNTDVTFTVYDANPLAGAVPEPQAWALLGLGFAVAGTGMRRRRLRAAA